jgi:hypothetical protein
VPGNALHTEATAATTAFDEVWLDPERIVHTQHAVREPAAVLARPDGYIGYRGQPASWENLSAHLERFLSPGHSLEENR